MTRKNVINTILVSGLLMLFSSSCALRSIKDDIAYDVGYEAEENSLISFGKSEISDEIEGNEIFVDTSIRLEEGQIPLTISKDKKEIFYLELNSVGREKLKVYIKGENGGIYSLKKIDIENKKTTQIKDFVPFFTTVKWNNKGDKVAFNGSGKLIIYDNENNKLVMSEKELKEDAYINYFEWSQDDMKIYTENPTLANGSIYYVNSGKKRESYYNDELIYYKGKLDNNYFYANVVAPYNTNADNVMPEVRTVLVNDEGKIVHEIIDDKYIGENNIFEFRFRDNYKKSLLQVGNIGFGLYYIENIFELKNIEKITDKFVYEAKFISNGGFAYTISNKEKEDNSYLLCIVDSTGKKIKEEVVGSSSFTVTPDGKKLYFDLPNREVFNIEELTVVESGNKKESHTSEENNEHKDIMCALRGAIDVGYKYILTGEKDKENLEKYIIDSKDPEQWAKYDAIKYIEENYVEPVKKEYEITIKLNNINKYRLNEKNMANIYAEIEVKDSFGTLSYNEHSFSMVENNKKWYLTGISTFPNSKEREKVFSTAKEYTTKGMLLDSSMVGLEFSQELKEKEVEIGQIQFWKMSEPHLSYNQEYSNYCKVYLIARENNKEEIYKMILKKDESKWIPVELEKERMSNLF
ncbi:hypothetical protein SH2C18_21780 [Clostridium sediminicola]|uniref:hypothetical protein n=1 Tax=Clostridium sediminicola TaxID=3114879 RepID=UPI0031F1FE22